MRRRRQPTRLRHGREIPPRQSVVVRYALALMVALAESVVASRYLGTQREEA